MILLLVIIVPAHDCRGAGWWVGAVESCVCLCLHVCRVSSPMNHSLIRVTHPPTRTPVSASGVCRL